MNLVTPASFNAICRNFHQDVDKKYPTADAMAAYAVRDLSGPDRIEIANFLDELLSGRFSRGEIRAVWRRSPADVYFRDNDHLVVLLKLIREKLG